jgi:hypothetical protein
MLTVFTTPLYPPAVPSVEQKTQADARLTGATDAAAWGRGTIMVTSPQTEYVVSVDRQAGVQTSKGLHLPGVHPRAIASSIDRNSLWVYGDSGILVRLSNDRLQPAELGRIQLSPPAFASWMVFGRSPVVTGRRRSTQAEFLFNEANTLERINDVRSELMVFVPTADGVSYFSSYQSGIVHMGDLSGLGVGMEAGAFDDATGYLYVLSSRGIGYCARVLSNAVLTAVNPLRFPNVEGPIQARVIGSILYVICESRNRLITYSLTDPQNPVQLTDAVFDTGLYWERNPVRLVDDTGAAVFKFNSFPAIPSNWPVIAAGSVPQSEAGPELKWILEGEVSRITFDVPDILPVTVFQSGGTSTVAPTNLSVGCILMEKGVIADQYSPDVSMSVIGGTRTSSSEAVAYDKNGILVSSKQDRLSVSYDQIPQPFTEVTVGYSDVINGGVPYYGARSWQGISDGSPIIRPWLRYRTFRMNLGDSDTPVRARVSAVVGVPTYTASFPWGSFANPADPIVTVTTQWEDEDGFLVVQLAAAPPVGTIITIQEGSFPTGTTQELGLCRQKVADLVTFVLAAGSVDPFPVATSYANDASGHAVGTYRVTYLDGAFYDPNTLQFFCTSMDGVTRIGVRTLTTQSYVLPDPTWLQIGVGNDAAATAAAASALAAGKQLIFSLTTPTRIAGSLLSVPVGCTGSVRLLFEKIP